MQYNKSNIYLSIVKTLSEINKFTRLVYSFLQKSITSVNELAYSMHFKIFLKMKEILCLKSRKALKQWFYILENIIITIYNKNTSIKHKYMRN